MAVAIPGEAFTFQVLFTDTDKVPIAVDDAYITVIRYTTNGTRVVVAADDLDADPLEVGRYSYTLTVPDSLTVGTSLYGTMTATDPGSGANLLTQETVDLVSDSTSTSCGMTARFVL